MYVVRSFSAFIWKCRNKAILKKKSSKSQLMWAWKGVWPQEGLKRCGL